MFLGVITKPKVTFLTEINRSLLAIANYSKSRSLSLQFSLNDCSLIKGGIPYILVSKLGSLFWARKESTEFINSQITLLKPGLINEVLKACQLADFQVSLNESHHQEVTANLQPPVKADNLESSNETRTEDQDDGLNKGEKTIVENDPRDDKTISNMPSLAENSMQSYFDSLPLDKKDEIESMIANGELVINRGPTPMHPFTLTHTNKGSNSMIKNHARTLTYAEAVGPGAGADQEIEARMTNLGDVKNKKSVRLSDGKMDIAASAPAYHDSGNRDTTRAGDKPSGSGEQILAGDTIRGRSLAPLDPDASVDSPALNSTGTRWKTALTWNETIRLEELQGKNISKDIEKVGEDLDPLDGSLSSCSEVSKEVLKRDLEEMQERLIIMEMQHKKDLEYAEAKREQEENMLLNQIRNKEDEIRNKEDEIAIIRRENEMSTVLLKDQQEKLLRDQHLRQQKIQEQLLEEQRLRLTGQQSQIYMNQEVPKTSEANQAAEASDPSILAVGSAVADIHPIPGAQSAPVLPHAGESYLRYRVPVPDDGLENTPLGKLRNKVKRPLEPVLPSGLQQTVEQTSEAADIDGAGMIKDADENEKFDKTSKSGITNAIKNVFK